MSRDPRFDILFEPIAIGPVVAKNRFYQVPHCSGMGYLMPETLAAMRGIKAEGGWGVVNTEYCSIHPTSDDTPYPHATNWDDGDVAALAAITDQVHRHDALAGIQLWHGGSRVVNALSRELSFGVASLPPSSNYPAQSRAMDKDDIRAFRRWHVDAAKRARHAGFDIVYVYAAHGYLLDQFLSPVINQRSDEYGGSLENRLRLLREILIDTKEAIGADCAVALRFAADDGGFVGVETGRSGRDQHLSSERCDMISTLADLPDLWDVTVRNWEMDMSSSRFFNEAPHHVQAGSRCWPLHLARYHGTYAANRCAGPDRRGAAIDCRPVPAEEGAGGAHRRNPRMHRLQHLLRGRPVRCADPLHPEPDHGRGMAPRLASGEHSCR
jgi:dimethylamine/trimethylamine dehydrogenase